jgi:hypothetical protein
VVSNTRGLIYTADCTAPEPGGREDSSLAREGEGPALTNNLSVDVERYLADKAAVQRAVAAVLFPHPFSPDAEHGAGRPGALPPSRPAPRRAARGIPMGGGRRWSRG